jgi:LuxR family transcriptional activator of conjugal transfer of Ti plasmids
MRTLRHSFAEFTDAIQTVGNETGFHKVAGRFAERLGFRWFAYIKHSAGKPTIISSYPRDWTARYVECGYQQLDPIVRRAKRDNAAFAWNSRLPGLIRTAQQRRFFGEAASFGVRGGLTVPIRAGFGRTAAFTLASDDGAAVGESAGPEFINTIHTAALYFHAHVAARQPRVANPGDDAELLTARERQCLGWIAQGKTAADIAVLIGTSEATASFHLRNVRIKLGANSIAQCVGEALRRGLLS